MIQYSFSPNWYRSQCVVFSQHTHTFYYASNCIIYKYDLLHKQIESELNVKNYLLKKLGYNFDKTKNNNNKKDKKQQFSKGQQKQQRQIKDNKSQKSLSISALTESKEKVLKVSTMQLLIRQDNKQDKQILIVGFNCIGLLILVSSQRNKLEIIQIIDINKRLSQLRLDKESQNKEIHGLEYIFVDSQRSSVEIFTVDGLRVNFRMMRQKDREGICQENQKEHKIELKVQSSRHILQGSNVVSKPQKLQKHIHIKSICKLHSCYVVFLANNIREPKGVIKTINIQEEQQNNLNQKKTSYINVIFYDPFFENVLLRTNLEVMMLRCQEIESSGQVRPQSKQNNRHFLIEESNIVSVDFIEIDQKDDKEYAILAKPIIMKQNIFCETLFLNILYSQNLSRIIQTKQQANSRKQKDQALILNQIQNQKPLKIKIEIIYPKKIHHKLSQQQKSTLTIKFIDENFVLITGRLGEMIIISLKQIQTQKLTSVTIKPYSYEEEDNKVWRIQHSQRHYQDVYGIYRVNGQKGSEQSNVDTRKNQTTNLYLIGTDHILTSWKSTQNKPGIYDPKLLAYDSSLKFLTSQAQQIILSQLEPSIVFLRLRDSNIRSFQPYSQRSYWLNEFWKHNSVSFCKQIEKIIMHPRQIGVAVMVNKQGKIILYDLYEERMIRLIEMKSNKKEKNNPENNKKQRQRQKSFSKDKKKIQQNKGTNSQKQIKQTIFQINTISYQHISIVKALQSIQNLHQNNQHHQKFLNQQKNPRIDSNNKEQVVDLKVQKFYEKQIDKQFVLMIQTNDNILALIENQQKSNNENKAFMIMKAYPKIVKLQRLHKTKYWDRKILIGTRKKKGQLMVTVYRSNILNYQQQSSRYNQLAEQADPSKENIELMWQSQLELPLGVSSRYIFKLSSFDCSSRNFKEEQNKNKAMEMEGYLLSVINYKNSKIVISVYCFQPQGQLRLRKVISSEELTITNISGTNNMNNNINIEHLIISQQQNQFLISLYNNINQSISLIDYTDLIQRAISLVNVENQSRSGKENDVKEGQCNQHQIKYENNDMDEMNSQNAKQKEGQYKRQSVTLLNLKSEQMRSIENTVQIKTVQFHSLIYKIQSMLFNQVFSDKEMSDITHLIILGKDQSVRLLNINPYLKTQTNINNQDKQQQSCNSYKTSTKAITLKIQQFCINKSRQNQEKIT